jgi:four helix bundle protein
MRFNQFEEILAWQKAREMAFLIYTNFTHTRDYGFRDQFQRASVSVMNNIAEGFDRQTRKEFRQGLYIAKGSCAEIRSMLYLAMDLEMLDHEEFNSLHSKAVEISRALAGLIKSLQT